jgi:hypothetical protein
MPIDNRTWPFLLRIYNRGRFLKRLVTGKNRLPTPPVPFGARLQLAWHGFLPDKYHLYNLRENNFRLYCSDWQVLMTQTIDGHYAAILYDKLLFETVVGQVANVPANFALIDRGSVTWLSDHPPPQHNLMALVRQQGKVILKPRNLDGGRGVHLLEYRDDAYGCDGNAVDEQALSLILDEARNSMVVEFVEQSAFASRLYPDSVNTIRFITFIDNESGKPFIAVAGMRIGCDKSAPRDNFYAGGLFVDHIDHTTGQLGKAMKPLDDGPGFEWIDQHPETGLVFQDQVIPDWENVCGSLLETAEKLPYLPLVAWDVALLEDGISIIEGNHWSMLSDFQCNRKLLEDPRVRAFFRHHNML